MVNLKHVNTITNYLHLDIYQYFIIVNKFALKVLLDVWIECTKLYTFLTKTPWCQGTFLANASVNATII